MYIYKVCVLKVLPGKGVSIIECNMKVDFTPPLRYKVPESMDKSDTLLFPLVISDGAEPSSATTVKT